MRNSKYQQLAKVIDGLPSGSVLTVADFTDIATPKTISKMLTRLNDSGKIVKVMRSVFWKKEEGRESPRPDDVAKALARENNWSLAPSGGTALHLMGIERDEPVVWTYVTSGTYRNYEYGGIKISFTHANWKFFANMSERTKLLVQCIKAYGKEHLSEEHLRGIWNKCRNFDWKKVVFETQNAANWIGKAILKLCGLKPAEAVMDKGKQY